MEESRDLLVDTGVYYVIDSWRDEVVCFSSKRMFTLSRWDSGNELCFSLLVNGILNLCSERLCKLVPIVQGLVFVGHLCSCF